MAVQRTHASMPVPASAGVQGGGASPLDGLLRPAAEPVGQGLPTGSVEFYNRDPYFPDPYFPNPYTNF